MMANEETITTIASNYDAFISFFGSDTRLSFTGNLFNALRHKRFKTFIDNDRIKSGDQIVASTFKALEGSKIAIVVFSKRYAASTYCLDELVKILECRNKINQRVLPIFYEVDPFEVRDQTGTYGKSFDAHEYRFGKDYVKLQNWKSALSEVAVLTGWHFQNRESAGSKCEYESIQDIVKCVSNTLPRYDVFLSFSEQDIHYSFSGYLYNALDREGFKIFMNAKGCKEDFVGSSRTLVTEAIEKSRLSIIVLSENYAYSSSSLDELVTILDVAKNNNNQLLVWPIFYKAEPSDIRHLKNSYEKAMNEHENEFGKNSEKVKRWRSALFEVANLKGWHFNYGYEYELVEKIVETAIKV